MSIVVHNVSKRFGDFQALDSVSVDVASGSLTALLGPSGSGKSTLLRIVAGLEMPDTGDILLAGSDATELSPQKRGVGFVFQHYAAFKHMTVRDNIGFGLKIRKRPKNEIRQRVQELLELVQLQGFGDRFPAQLSGGQRQRMALARALAPEPKVLLLDEPFGALDARVRAELRLWLRRLHDETHTTTVIVTHDQEEALEVADRIVVLNRGHVEQVGSPQDVYDHPQSAFVYEFLGAANRLPGTVAGRGFVAEGAAAPIAVDADFAGPANAYVRPHDLQLWPAGDGHRDGIAVDVRRVIPLGGSVRVELEARTGGALEAELDRDAWRALALQVGDGATAVPRAVRVFPAH